MDMIIAAIDAIDENAVFPAMFDNMPVQAQPNLSVQNDFPVFCSPNAMDPNFDEWHGIEEK
jgi:hypothetical protein